MLGELAGSDHPLAERRVDPRAGVVAGPHAMRLGHIASPIGTDRDAGPARRPGRAVVGAYPEGREWDLLRGRPGERPKADRNIAALSIPDNDPIYGAEGPLRQIWKFASAKPK